MWQSLCRSRKKKRTYKEIKLSYQSKTYSTPQSYGKALKKSLKSQPHSPRKGKVVVGELAIAVGLQLDNKMKKLKQTLNTEKQEKVTDFFSIRILCTLLLVLKTFIKI